jgi:hypothetical protein
VLDTVDSSIQRELRADERLLWKGAPRSGIRFRSIDIFLIPFSLLWGGFAFFAVGAALIGAQKNSPAGWMGVLFTLPFLLAGLYIIFGRFLLDRAIRRRIAYAVTSRRAIIASGLFSRSTKSIELRSTPEITVSERSDGSGNITFGPTGPLVWAMSNSLWFPGGGGGQPAFEMIEDVRRVYDIIQRASRS